MVYPIVEQMQRVFDRIEANARELIVALAAAYRTRPVRSSYSTRNGMFAWPAWRLPS
jgi:hypothetical protein